MGKTSIEWTDETWNPVRGCSRVSEGCRNCYAERQAARFSGPRLVKDNSGVLADGKGYQDSHSVPGPFSGFVHIVNGHAAWTGKVELVEKHLEDPIRWKQPRRIFVNSMSDLWHEKLPRVEIARVYAVMAYCQWHEFQVLTKRPEVRWRYTGLGNDVRSLLQSILERRGPLAHPKPFRWPLPNVWEGVSVEGQNTADERIPVLLQTPAAVRFVSYEPALGPVDFRTFIGGPDGDARCFRCGEEWGGGIIKDHRCPMGFGGRLDQIIIGAESGPGARPFNEDWARAARDQCVASGVAFFYKQKALRGRKIPTPELDGQKWMQFPEAHA